MTHKSALTLGCRRCYLHMYVCMFICMYYIFIYMFMCVCMHVYVCVCVYNAGANLYTQLMGDKTHRDTCLMVQNGAHAKKKKLHNSVMSAMSVLN